MSSILDEKMVSFGSPAKSLEFHDNLQSPSPYKGMNNMNMSIVSINDNDIHRSHKKDLLSTISGIKPTDLDSASGFSHEYPNPNGLVDNFNESLYSHTQRQLENDIDNGSHIGLESHNTERSPLLKLGPYVPALDRMV